MRRSPHLAVALALLWICVGFFVLPVDAQSGPAASSNQKPRPELIEIDDPWFEVYRILPGVFTLREPGHWERVISYLVVGTERALLFDTGTGISDIRAVVTKLTDLEIVVVNSHSHPDHIGGNHAFPTIWAPDTEAARKAAGGRSVEDSQRFVPPRAFSRQPPSTFSRDSYRIRPYEITRFLTDGELIDLGDRSLEVWLTPGHAEDALCLIDRRSRLVFTGDTFYLGKIFVSSTPGSLSAFIATASRLASLTDDIDRVLPAHSATLLQPHFLRRFGKAAQQIKKGSNEPKQLPDGRREYSFERFSILVPPSATSD